MTRFAKLLAPAVALSVAFGGVAVPSTLGTPAAVAQTTGAQPVIDTTGFTTAQWTALTAQATLEMVNEYRVANGLHPLRTHVVYNTNAENYSKEMARTGVFEHSNPKKWGWSGENILFRNSYLSNVKSGTNIPHDQILNPPKMTKEQWARLAVLMFEDWRNSPPHNQGMLNSEFQGIGLGIAFDGDNTAWGTTMFYNEAVTLTDGSRTAVQKADPKTVEAKESGKSFYMAGGAMRALGIAGVPNPTDRKGYNPSYSGFSRKVSVKYPNGQVVEETRTLSISGGRAGQEEKNKGLQTSADSRIWQVQTKPATSTTSSTPTSEMVASPNFAEVVAPVVLPSATTPKPTLTTSARTPNTTSPEPSIPARPTPTPKTSTSTSTTTPMPTPTPKTTPTPTPTPAPAPAPAPESEGSSLSVGGIIGIVVGVLAALGLGAAAMGMMNGGFKLPF